MTHSTGLPDIAINTPNWGMEVNEAFEEANRRLTLTGLLGPLPRTRSEEHEAFEGETPSWVGQTYVQTTPLIIWISTGLTVTNWMRVDKALQLVGVASPQHTEDEEDTVTNAGVVPSFVGQTYFQTATNVTWVATGTTNTSWHTFSRVWKTHTFANVVTDQNFAFTTTEYFIKAWTAGGGGASSSVHGSFAGSPIVQINGITGNLAGGLGGASSSAGILHSTSPTTPSYGIAGLHVSAVAGVGADGGPSGISASYGQGHPGNYYEFYFASETPVETTLRVRQVLGGSGATGILNGASGTMFLRYR